MQDFEQDEWDALSKASKVQYWKNRLYVFEHCTRLIIDATAAPAGPGTDDARANLFRIGPGIPPENYVTPSPVWGKVSPLHEIAQRAIDNMIQEIKLRIIEIQAE